MGRDREDVIEMDGFVEEAMPGTLFKVNCGGHIVLATLSGRLRVNKIRVLPNDTVKVEVSPYDSSRGRITRRE
jgi:translation initiation factor IF-1